MNAISSSALVRSVLLCKEETFTEKALEVFNFQYQYNNIYRAYCDILKTEPTAIDSLEKIPFLPIQFFKSKEIKGYLSGTRYIIIFLQKMAGKFPIHLR